MGEAILLLLAVVFGWVLRYFTSYEKYKAEVLIGELEGLTDTEKAKIITAIRNH